MRSSKAYFCQRLPGEEIAIIYAMIMIIRSCILDFRITVLNYFHQLIPLG